MLLGLVPCRGLGLPGRLPHQLGVSRIVSISSVLASRIALLMAGAGAPGAYLGLVCGPVMVIWAPQQPGQASREEPRLGQKGLPSSRLRSAARTTASIKAERKFDCSSTRMPAIVAPAGLLPCP